MNLTLVCQTHELGKFRLGLAKESRIWPVYIDKSTPTDPDDHTLDKYLNLDICLLNSDRNARSIPLNLCCRAREIMAAVPVGNCRQGWIPYENRYRAPARRHQNQPDGPAGDAYNYLFFNKINQFVRK